MTSTASFRPPRLQTWGLFGLWALVLSALSFAGFPNGFQLALFGAGIVLPLLAAWVWGSNGTSPPGPVLFEEFLPPIPAWSWVCLFCAALFLRFWGLEGNFPLPIGDECLIGRIAIDLSHGWDGKFFYFPGQHTPLLLWTTALWFRFIHSPFLALRLTPAILSAASVPLAFSALRVSCSRSFCFLGTGLWAFSLWSLGTGRCCEMGTLVLPWELACFALLAVFLGKPVDRAKERAAAALGFALGLCYWTFTNWPFIVLLVVLTAFAGLSPPFIRNRGYGALFLVSFAAAFAPFLWFAWHEGYSPINQLLASLGAVLSPGQKSAVAFSYFSSMWWGPLQGVVVYFKINFERLNPFLGACFFLGLVQVLRNRRHPWARWILLAFGLCCLPAFFSSYVETLRILTVLPVLLLTTGWGLAQLLTTFPKEKRPWVLGLFLLASVGTDFGRTLDFYRDPGQAEGRQRREFLDEMAGGLGPALVFPDFWPRGDHSLFVSTYGFNAFENPALDPARARWAVLTVNAHYYPFLSARLAGGRWSDLGSVEPGEEEMLGVFPLNGPNRREVEKWSAAEPYFHRLVGDIDQINLPRTYAAAKAELDRGPALVAGDRFLESFYWEMAAQFYYHFDYRDHFEDLAAALRHATEDGYGAAHLYYKLGSLYLQKRDFAEAKKDFDKALRAEPGYADAQGGEILLQRMEREKD